QAVVRVALSVIVWSIVAFLPARLLAELRQQRIQLQLSASTDTLTGLNNRARLTADLAAVDRSATLLLIDLDYFKDYNDTHGHIAGDALLRDFADLLRERCRSGDVTYRYGGEE